MSTDYVAVSRLRSVEKERTQRRQDEMAKWDGKRFLYGREAREFRERERELKAKGG